MEFIHTITEKRQITIKPNRWMFWFPMSILSGFGVAIFWYYAAVSSGILFPIFTVAATTCAIITLAFLFQTGNYTFDEPNEIYEVKLPLYRKIHEPVLFRISHGKLQCHNSKRWKEMSAEAIVDMNLDLEKLRTDAMAAHSEREEQVKKAQSTIDTIKELI
jgi:GH15 family glucan-1,4-alpha-glucosidase